MTPEPRFKVGDEVWVSDFGELSRHRIIDCKWEEPHSMGANGMLPGMWCYRIDGHESWTNWRFEAGLSLVSAVDRLADLLPSDSKPPADRSR